MSGCGSDNNVNIPEPSIIIHSNGEVTTKPESLLKPLQKLMVEDPIE